MDSDGQLIFGNQRAMYAESENPTFDQSINNEHSLSASVDQSFQFQGLMQKFGLESTDDVDNFNELNSNKIDRSGIIKKLLQTNQFYISKYTEMPVDYQTGILVYDHTRDGGGYILATLNPSDQCHSNSNEEL